MVYSGNGCLYNHQGNISLILSYVTKVAVEENRNQEICIRKQNLK
ncbi:Uncharacterised protein [Chryseobacterium nakagawai]|nr:Uncharacterised protein [Chryseobacterium nakagawai]